MKSETLDNTPQLAESTIRYWEPTWIYNSIKNHSFLVSDDNTLREGVYDVVSHPKVINKVGIIVGSGPSLDKADFTAIHKNREKLFIICATSNINCLLARGIAPDGAMVVDASPETGSTHLDIIGGSNATRNISLFAPPVADPQLFRRWRGPIYLYRPHQPGNDFLERVLPKMFTRRVDGDSQYRWYIELLQIGLLNAGCVTNGAILLMHFLGVEPVAMIGVDFGFYLVDGKPTGWCTRFRKRGKQWLPYPHHDITVREIIRRGRTGDVWTTSEMLQYKLNLFVVWRLSHDLPLFQTHNNGLLRSDEIPVAPLSDIIRDPAAHISEYPATGDLLQKHVEAAIARMGIKSPIVTSTPSASVPNASAPPTPILVKEEDLSVGIEKVENAPASSLFNTKTYKLKKEKEK